MSRAVIAGDAHPGLAREIARLAGLPLVAASVSAFADGETRVRISSWWSERAAEREATSSAQPATTDVTARLASLAELHGKGELTDEEYASAKAQVLAGS